MADDESEEHAASSSDDDNEVTSVTEQTDSGDDAGPARVALDRVAALGPVLPTGFAQSLVPKINLKPLVDRTLGIKYGWPVKALADQVHAWNMEMFQAINPMRSLMEGFEQRPRSMVSGPVDLTGILRDFRRLTAPYTRTFAKLPRLLLPPNLRPVSNDITASEVFDFLREEGIPLYLVPRAAIGKRLVLSKDHAARRKVLTDKFDDIVDDCTALLDTCAAPITAVEVEFIRDGIGALRAGHHASAQAIFTVTLDTLISRFYPDRDERRKITNRKRDALTPGEINHMGMRDAYVWLPVWNAHLEYWQHKGDRIPNDYSRHATVHGVSKTQFSKRNCVQALMLASSLIGYANQLTRSANPTSDKRRRRR